MKMIFGISYSSKTHFYEYLPLYGDDGQYIGYSRQMDSYYRPLFLLKQNSKIVCSLQDDSLLRPWFGFLDFIPIFRPKYTLKIEDINEESILTYNGVYYTIKMGEDIYAIKGHSHCVVTIWKNDLQVALIKRYAVHSYEKMYEEIEILYDKNISKLLISLFGMFGWHVFVGREGGRTIATFYIINEKYDKNWRPSE